MHWHVGHVTALAGITDFTPPLALGQVRDLRISGSRA